MSKINIEINGKTIEAEQGQMIIEVADKENVRIPRFCYHKKLSIAANCRMCLVQIEKSPKPVPACATPITDGMKVYTRSPMALQAQKAVMEFLLINHPLDCPVCDQGGECELQDVSMGYGEGVSQYTQGKRSVKDKDLGPLVSTDMTRCIHCTRCVRFGSEVSNLRELGLVNRGEDSEISTYIQKNVTSELSGNIIDLCPVGALTNKPFRFKARAWEMKQHPTIAAHDCIGSHLFVHERRQEVMRTVPRECETINETWISDRDRFSHFGLESDERVLSPLIKVNGEWQTTDWATALEASVAGLQKVIHTGGEGAIGALASPNETLENLYLMQTWLRGLGVKHIDHRLKEQDFSDQAAFPTYPHLDITLDALEHAGAVLLIGSNTRKEQPLLWHRLNKAQQNGAAMLAIAPFDIDYLFPLKAHMTPSQGDMVVALSQLAKALGCDKQHLPEVQVTEAAQQMADTLKKANNPVLLLGALANHHPQASLIRALSQSIAKETGAKLGLATTGANAAGAWLTGILPHRKEGGAPAKVSGLNASTMLNQPLKAYVLLNVEPEYDCADTAKALSAMHAAEFVLSIATFTTPDMLEYADVILPATPSLEMSGTLINVQGDWQQFHAVVPPKGESRPAWKIFRVLGELCHLDEMAQYQTLGDVFNAIHSKAGNCALESPHWTMSAAANKPAAGLIRLAETPLYAIDPVVRRSAPLQATVDANFSRGVHLCEHLANELGVTAGDKLLATQNEGSVELVAVIDNRIPADSVYIAQGIAEHKGLGAAYQPIELKRV